MFSFSCNMSNFSKRVLQLVRCEIIDGRVRTSSKQQLHCQCSMKLSLTVCYLSCCTIFSSNNWNKILTDSSHIFSSPNWDFDGYAKFWKQWGTNILKVFHFSTLYLFLLISVYYYSLLLRLLKWDLAEILIKMQNIAIHSRRSSKVWLLC